MNKIKLKTVPPFPGQVLDGVGVGVADQNGNWTVTIDYSELPLVSPYTPNPTHTVLIYDSVMNDYFLVPITLFP